MTTSIPRELLEKVTGAAVLGPDDTLVLVVDERLSAQQFEALRAAIAEACDGSLRDRVVAVAGVDVAAVLRR